MMIEGLKPDEWLAHNRGQVEAIVRVVCKGYRWSDYEILKDLVSRVILSLVRLRSLDRYNPARGTWRTFFYTCVANQVDAARRYDKRAQRGSDAQHIPYESLYNEPAGSSWVDETDARIDASRWLKDWSTTASPKARRVVKLLLKGETPSEIARKHGVSRQRIWQVQLGAHEHYDRWQRR